MVFVKLYLINELSNIIIGSRYTI